MPQVLIYEAGLTENFIIKLMAKNEISKTYSAGDIDIVWKPGKCIHAGICVKTFPQVYKPHNKPWITPEGMNTEALINQIDSCPSGALSYIHKDTKENTKAMEHSKVAGKSPLIVDIESGKGYAWCACGRSSKQPWCDGSHAGTGITPTVFKAIENKKAAICMCKRTGNGPYCDGSHAGL